MQTLTRLQLLGLLGLWVIALIVTGVSPRDHGTWWMEVAPIFPAALALVLTHDSFPLPRFILFWIFVHGLVLMIGGHYTYAEVPLGYWLKDLFDLSRNPYDRIGHLLQGFVPALIAREILVRKVRILHRGWLFFLTLTVCMSISLVYEFIEWWAALILGQGADAFLGSQGDPWDTQWDMFCATIGATLAQLIYFRRKA